jgi:hypothetical protein
MTKCRNCGNTHAGGCAQFFASQSRATPPKEAAREEKEAAPNVPNTAAARRTAAWRAQNAEKHRRYMRDLMRKRRAAGRDKAAAA